MPLDILVPYWGDPTLMRETVESVLAQDNGDWRLTVVDDAYPDTSVTHWLRTISDERVRAIRNDRNLGITANYRQCLSLATQDLVVFLGCDDLLLANYVDVILDAHRAWPGAVMIQPGVRVVDETGARRTSLVDTVKQRLLQPRTRHQPVLMVGEALATSLLLGNWLYWPSLAFRRDALRDVDFREGLPIIQDFALELDLVCRDASLVFDPAVCFVYRRHTSSASATTLMDGTRFADERTYYGIAADQMRARGWRRAERAARLRLTSRAHAVTLVPRALADRRWSAARDLGHHVMARR